MRHMFLSGFSSCLESMIVYKKALGFSEKTYIPRAKSFDRYCSKNWSESSVLSKAVALGWLECLPNESPSAFHNRACFIRCFGHY